MLYQLPNGRTVYLTIEEYLNLSDSDIQFLVSNCYGQEILNPFHGSICGKDVPDKEYDFSYLSEDDDEITNSFNDISDDDPFDDIIDISGPLDM